MSIFVEPSSVTPSKKDLSWKKYRLKGSFCQKYVILMSFKVHCVDRTLHSYNLKEITSLTNSKRYDTTKRSNIFYVFLR